MKEPRITRVRNGVPFESAALPSPERALELYFRSAQLRAPQEETIGLDRALGRVLARPIISDGDYPAAPRSTMDGFAVRASETPGRFEIAGQIQMGRQSTQPLEARAAVHIPTGGTLPAGADCVVPIEGVEQDGEAIVVHHAIPDGDCVHAAGADMRAGELLLSAGRRIGGPELGVLATLGYARICVYRIPVFAILSSGDELVEVDAAPSEAQVRDSNSYAIGGTLEAMGAHARRFPRVPDDPLVLERTLGDAIARTDGVVISGGSSVGPRDFTPEIIDRMGKPGVLVHGLKVKPGKPTVLASVDGKPVIGLPGNPASALVVLEAVASAIVGALTGAPANCAIVEAVMAAPYSKRPGWTWYVPMRLEREGAAIRAFPYEIRSANVSLFARASGFAALGEAVELLAAGDRVQVRRFSRGGAP